MGGKVCWSEDGATILCPASEVINVLDVSTGRVRCTLGTTGEEISDIVLTFTANLSCELVISAHRSGLFKYWDATSMYSLRTQ